MSNESDHPSDNQLRSYAAGQLNEGESGAIENHLDGCEECVRRVEFVTGPGDRFLEALKDAQGADGSASNRYSGTASTQNRQTGEETNRRAVHRPGLLEAGTSFGRYTLGEVLGRGAFATVYRGVDRKLDREVAVKVLGEGANSQDVRRFFREARAAGQLSHKNICPVYDTGQQDGIRYIVMGLVKGQTLREFIDSGKKIKTKQAIHAVYKLASALMEAHKQGIVHRDLKPANIMVDADRKELVILDFGLAQRMDPRGSRMTHAGDILGTPVYMAPEQVQGDTKKIGPQSDVYALGIILYELLAGHRPFVGSIAEVFARILYEEPVPPSAYSEGLNPALDTICLKALAKDLDGRFQSMREFRDALVDFSKVKSGSLSTDIGRLSDNIKVDWSPQPEVTRVPIDDETPSLALASPAGSARDAKSSCPECNATLPPGTLLCDACGYHQGIRQKFDAFSRQSEAAEATQERSWLSDQLAEGETPDSLALAVMAIVPLLAVGVTVWLWSTFHLLLAISVALLFVAMVVAVVKSAGWRMDPKSAQLYFCRVRGWRPLRPPRFRKVLDMRGTGTTDKDLQSLKREWNIEVLDLENSRVTDMGIDYLARLDSLRFLVLRGTQVSPEGFEELRQRLPKTRTWR